MYRFKGDIVEFLAIFTYGHKLADIGEDMPDEFSKKLADTTRMVANSAFDIGLKQVTGDYKRYGGAVNLAKCLVMRIGREKGNVKYQDIVGWYLDTPGVKLEDINDALRIAVEEGMVFEKEKDMYAMPFSIIGLGKEIIPL